MVGHEDAGGGAGVLAGFGDGRRLGGLGGLTLPLLGDGLGLLGGSTLALASTCLAVSTPAAAIAVRRSLRDTEAAAR
ncbi:hypothetical protein [Intrasporangium chromatireducens]|uniref:hypothetical protein n=1 Tax=Intrasporangium chromatireducens TaxID=1386088 RepID=UPI0004B4D0D1|nr:hypothetical protein [Intrasporangium chromatireducens]